jgi:putative AdoMet-dependent methyltransferase
MKSINADLFNHDRQADGYDNNVKDENNPIRKGYTQALTWLGSQVPAIASVLDLGTGTGNTIDKLPIGCSVVAVDISTKMISIAKDKLKEHNVTYIVSDILTFFHNHPTQKFNAIVSSYAIHHLTGTEKEQLFSHIMHSLEPNGRAVFVDLMYKNTADLSKLVQLFEKKNPDTVADIQEEYFWNIEQCSKQLQKCGFKLTLLQFSELSWGILAVANGK